MRIWVEEAACAGADPELFAPLHDRAPEIQQAKSLCRSCPVRIDCLNDAFDMSDDTTIRGGHTARERRFLKRHEAVIRA
jgi:WhiB family redox-sensing transcriptional regulator